MLDTDCLSTQLSDLLSFLWTSKLEERINENPSNRCCASFQDTYTLSTECGAMPRRSSSTCSGWPGQPTWASAAPLENILLITNSCLTRYWWDCTNLKIIFVRHKNIKLVIITPDFAKLNSNWLTKPNELRWSILSLLSHPPRLDPSI